MSEMNRVLETVTFLTNRTTFTHRCGFATVHDVIDKSLEDRMESFFLSETMKYLYLVRAPDSAEE